MTSPLVPLVAVASLVPATPALYIVSTTEAGPLESISAGTDLLTSHPGYLLGGLLGVAVVFFVGRSRPTTGRPAHDQSTGVKPAA